EGRLEPGEILDGRIAPRRFVRSKECRSRPALELDRYDLALEPAFFDRIQRAAMALRGQLVLIFAGDAPLARDVLRGVAHVDFIKRVGQRSDQGVNRGDVVQPGPP